MRLNKFLSGAGICSRREADRLIEEKRVLVNGRTAEMGMQVSGDERICVDGKELGPVGERVYLAYYKPRGIVCTFEPREKNNLFRTFSYPVRVTYAGRLDKDSEGLLLLTNDGDMIDAAMRARNFHEKEYAVETDRKITDAFIEKMSGGLWLEELEAEARPCRVWRTGEREFHIVLTQGLNRQIRRMCAACGFRVNRLVRIRIMNILLGELKPGCFRALNREELGILRSDLRKAKETEQEGREGGAEAARFDRERKRKAAEAPGQERKEREREGAERPENERERKRTERQGKRTERPGNEQKGKRTERPGNEREGKGRERPGNEQERKRTERPGNEPERMRTERPGNERKGKKRERSEKEQKGKEQRGRETNGKEREQRGPETNRKERKRGSGKE